MNFRVAYWRLGQKGRRFGTFEEAWHIRSASHQDHVPIYGFSKSGKVVLMAPGHEVEGVPVSQIHHAFKVALNGLLQEAISNSGTNKTRRCALAHYRKAVAALMADDGNSNEGEDRWI